MKFSYQWLSELAPGLDADPAQLERLITMKTAECEGIEAYGVHFANVVAVRVLSMEALTKGKNNAVLIDVGDGAQKLVVCGAQNVRAGMLAAWVPPGASLGGKIVGNAVIEGVESEGMLASAAELGINRDHSGLLELYGVAPGQPLPGLKPDWIIEIDNKSLTHRPDLWGHYGMAREVAAITQHRLVDPVKIDVLPKGPPIVKVQIENFSLCHRYSALLVENVQVGPSPLWLQARLESTGLNPINNIVDITNCILLELPQPMHAFDADKLTGDTIFVRNARPGETLKALNGETYELAVSDLVIADAAGPVALAGVIGGADTAISETTTRILFESANFLATSVRLTSARHKLRTDASMRFEKSLDPENTVRGLARAIGMVQQLLPAARVAGGVSDCRGPFDAHEPIALPVEFVVRKLGKGVEKEQIAAILTALGFGVGETSPDLLSVTVPTWRATKDISIKDDLVEEIGRMVGYGEITPAAPLVASIVPAANPMRAYLRAVRFQLTAQGFTEVSNYSFVQERDVKRFSMDIEDHVAVRNPIASEQTHLRRSLLPGLFKNVLNNARHLEDFRLFEVGNEIHPEAGPGLPREAVHGAAMLYNVHGAEEDFFEVKRVVEVLLPDARVHAAKAHPYEHPVRSAAITWGGSCVGRLAELHPSLLHEEGLQGRAFLFDIDLQLTQQLASAHEVRYQQVRKYPTSGFDLSIITNLHTAVATIEGELRKLGGDAIAQIYFVRQYTGRPLPDGQKSVSYHIEIGALDHTLTAEEAGESRNKMIDGMRAQGYELRV